MSKDGGEHPEDLDRPEHIGRFVVGAELGRGGMGLVWSGQDPVLLRDVAVKVLREDVAGDRSARVARFVTEGRITSQLEHPGIVPVHELGHDQHGNPYLVMRRVYGRTLADALLQRSGGGPSSRLLSAFVQICQAVGYAHHRGVVHRDLKPANVLLGDHGEVLVVDWGLAAVRGAPTQAVSGVRAGERYATVDGSIVGTLGYLAPEIAEGALNEVGPRSDVFSLGAVLYEILCGRPAIAGDDLYLATLEGQVEDPRTHEPGLDDGIVAICTRALSLYPSDRYADARELAEAVLRWQEGTERRERADHEVVEGRRQLGAFADRRAVLDGLEQAVRRWERDLQPWLPLDHPEKRKLHEGRAELETGRIEQAKTLAAILAAGESALRFDVAHVGARDLLADAMWMQFEDAERRGNQTDAVYFRDRLAVYDRGPRLMRLLAAGSVSLRTEPSGARVLARQVNTAGVIWALGPPRDLGATPLREVALEPGSWVLEVVHAERPPVRYPVRIERGRSWAVHGERPLRLPTAAELGEEWVFVPGGPYLAGGDPDVNLPRPFEECWVEDFFIGRFPVTAAEYAVFLDHLWRKDAELAASRVPRVRAGADIAQLWPGRPAVGWQFPLRDRDGDVWDATWPVCGISWDDAQAYAAWRSETTHRVVSPVTEDGYEKAARGTDGRYYPWGNAWDAALCKNISARPETPRPEPIGAFPSDTSVYGVRDLAGGMRTWCSESQFGGNAGLRPMRGGAWASNSRLCRPANRYGMEPASCHQYLGFRVMSVNTREGNHGEV